MKTALKAEFSAAEFADAGDFRRPSPPSREIVPNARADYPLIPTPLPKWVKGGCGRQADGTAGLPPASEMPEAFRHLRFVPTTDLTSESRNVPQGRIPDMTGRSDQVVNDPQETSANLDPNGSSSGVVRLTDSKGAIDADEWTGDAAVLV